MKKISDEEKSAAATLSDMEIFIFPELMYALVLANIVADVIIPLSAFARRFLAEDGAFICSGIIDDRRAEVENALRRNGFELVRHYREDEWNCYLCK